MPGLDSVAVIGRLEVVFVSSPGQPLALALCLGHFPKCRLRALPLTAPLPIIWRVELPTMQAFVRGLSFHRQAGEEPPKGEARRALERRKSFPLGPKKPENKTKEQELSV